MWRSEGVFVVWKPLRIFIKSIGGRNNRFKAIANTYNMYFIYLFLNNLQVMILSQGEAKQNIPWAIAFHAPS